MCTNTQASIGEGGQRGAANRSWSSESWARQRGLQRAPVATALAKPVIEIDPERALPHMVWPGVPGNSRCMHPRGPFALTQAMTSEVREAEELEEEEDDEEPEEEEPGASSSASSSTGG